MNNIVVVNRYFSGVICSLSIGLRRWRNEIQSTHYFGTTKPANLHFIDIDMLLMLLNAQVSPLN